MSFKQEFKRIQEEGQVPYITDIELDGMMIASRKSIVTALRVRFETVPAEINERLETIENLDVLEKLLKQAITTVSVQEFQVKLDEIPSSESDEEDYDY
jgi:hypothetical protein